MHVAVAPVEANGVAAYGFDQRGFGSRVKHGQLARLGMGRIAGLAPGVAAFFIAQRTGAGVAEECEAVVTAVAVRPLDIHTRT